MPTIGRAKYWKNTLCGLVCGLMMVGAGSVITKKVYLNNPAHDAWEEKKEVWEAYQAWRQNMEKTVLQHHFEKSLTDPNYREWPGDADTYNLSTKIIAVRHWPLDSIYQEPSIKKVSEKYLHCSQSGTRRSCEHAKPLKALDNSERLRQLLNGVQEYVTPLPSQEIPEEYKSVATITSLPPEPAPYLPIPPWWNWLLWTLFSLGCAAGYFGIGRIGLVERWDYDSRKRLIEPGFDPQSDPFRQIPQSLGGWLLYLLWLPGYLTAYALWGIKLVLTTPLQPVQWTRNLRRRFASIGPQDDYAAEYRTLLRLKKEAENLKNQELVENIDAEIEKIDQARTDQAAEAAKTISKKLAQLKPNLAVKRELRQITSKS